MAIAFQSLACTWIHSYFTSTLLLFWTTYEPNVLIHPTTSYNGAALEIIICSSLHVVTVAQLKDMQSQCCGFESNQANC